MRVALVDTGPLYALVDPDDRHHERARSELARLNADGRVIVLVTPVLMECYSLVLYRLGIAAAHRWLDEVRRGTGRVDPQPSDTSAASERVLRYTDQRVSLFDAVLAEISDRLETPVWTFDHHFDLMQVEVWS